MLTSCTWLSRTPARLMRTNLAPLRSSSSEVLPEYRDDPRKLDLIRVRSAGGELVPLGNAARVRLDEGPVEATMKLRGLDRSGSIYNVYGTVPGKHYGTEEDQFIVVQTHYDGWACNEASGTSVVLALDVRPIFSEAKFLQPK